MAQPYDYLNYQYPTSNPLSGGGTDWQDPYAGGAIGTARNKSMASQWGDYGLSTTQGMGQTGGQQGYDFGLTTAQGMGQQRGGYGMQSSYGTQAIPEAQFQPGTLPTGNGSPAPQIPQWYQGAPALNYSQGYANPYTGFGVDAWRDPKNQSAAQAWSSTTIPYQQLQQNAWQYTADFNEAQRRWNAQMQWQQASDQFNMSNTARQQQMAEWQANEAARQWAAQFGYQQEADRFSQDLANRQLGWTQEQGRGELGNQRYATDVELQLGTGRNQNEAQQIAIQDWYNRQRAATESQQVTGSLANEAQQIAVQDWYNRQRAETERQQVTGQLGNEARSIDVQDWYNRSRAQTDQAAVDVDRLWKTGQLTNQQREMALAELTQAQNENFRQAQLAQEGALQREQMANSQRIAAMQTFGRAQMPNTRYIRNWA